MKTLLITCLLSLTTATTAFARNGCYAEATAAAKFIFDQHADKDGTAAVRMGEPSMYLGDKKHALGVEGLVGKEKMRVRVDFDSGSSCRIIKIALEEIADWEK